MSRVMCHFFLFSFYPDQLVELVGGGSVINGVYPVKFLKKDKKNPDTLAFVNNYNFYDTQTDEHGESLTNPVQAAKLLKIQLYNSEAVCRTAPATPGLLNMLTADNK